MIVSAAKRARDRLTPIQGRVFQRRATCLFLAAFAYLAVLPRDAYAYLDPGTGSMILQLLAAGVVTATVVFRRSIARVFGLFRKGKGPPHQ